MSTPLALKVDSLRIAFDGVTILEVNELSVASGEIVGLVGLSGAGKTSFLRAVAGDLPFESGTIKIDGVDTADAQLTRQVSRTLQSFPLLHWMTVQKSIALAARLRGVRRLDSQSLLERFHAAHLSHRLPARLSGGERCRVSLAMALLGEPRVLLLDEPFNGLDSLVKRDIARSLLGSARELKCGVILVTHDLHDAAEYCDRAIVLQHKHPSLPAGSVVCQTPTASSEILHLLGNQSGGDF